MTAFAFRRARAALVLVVAVFVGFQAIRIAQYTEWWPDYRGCSREICGGRLQVMDTLVGCSCRGRGWPPWPSARGFGVSSSRLVVEAGTALEEVALEDRYDWSAHDLREADHRDEVVLPDLAVVELAEEGGHLVRAADLRVVVLDLAR